jgi:DNA replication protein DnaC
MANPLRPRRHRRADGPRFPQGCRQRRRGRSERRGQIHDRPQHRSSGGLAGGHTALFTSAGQLLGDLSSIDSASALRRRLNHYAAPALLIIDEVGYLSYSSRHADMLFELINRRYETKSTVVTTNRAFCDWHEVFPGAACVVSLVDRLVHNAEVIAIDGDSYRLKEATERANQRARQRRAPSS